MKEKEKIIKLAKELTDLLGKEEDRQIKTSMKPDGSFKCNYTIGIANTISYELYEMLCKLFDKKPKLEAMKNYAPRTKREKVGKIK